MSAVFVGRPPERSTQSQVVVNTVPLLSGWERIGNPEELKSKASNTIVIYKHSVNIAASTARSGAFAFASAVASVFASAVTSVFASAYAASAASSQLASTAVQQRTEVEIKKESDEQKPHIPKILQVTLNREDEINRDSTVPTFTDQDHPVFTGERPMVLRLAFQEGTSHSDLLEIMDDSGLTGRRLGEIYTFGVGLPNDPTFRSETVTFKIGIMRSNFVNKLFEFFVAIEIFTREEAEHFKALCECKAVSTKELHLIKKMNASVAAKEYREAIIIAREIQLNAIEENKAKHRVYRFQLVNSQFVNDAAYAVFDLVKMLRLLSPVHAYEACEILDTSSPNYTEAQKLKLNIILNFSEELVREELNKTHGRSERIKVLQLLAGLQPVGRLGDLELRPLEQLRNSKVIKQTFDLLERHAGFDPFNPRDRLFPQINTNHLDDDSLIDSFIHLLLCMVEKLYEQEKIIQTLTKVHTPEKDLKKTPAVSETDRKAIAEKESESLLESEQVSITPAVPTVPKQETPVLKKDAIPLPAGWKKIGEDKLDALELPDSQSVIVYTLQESTSSIVTTNPEGEKKKVAETEGNRVLKQVIIERAKWEHCNFETGEYYVSRERLISLQLVFSEGSIPKILYEKLIIPSYCIVFDCESLKFALCGMREHFKSLLLTCLEEENIITPAEKNFLNEITIGWHQEISEKENRLLQAMKLESTQGQYQKAVLIAKEVHGNALQENTEKNRCHRIGMRLKQAFLDDANAGVLLGIQLSNTSPQDAMDAFQLVTPASPYYRMVQEHLAGVVLNLSVTLRTEEQMRLYRKQVIKNLIRSEQTKEAMLFIEQQAGFNVLGDPQKRLFGKCSETDFLNASGYFQGITLHILVPMADRLCAQKAEIQCLHCTSGSASALVGTTPPTSASASTLGSAFAAAAFATAATASFSSQANTARSALHFSSVAVAAAAGSASQANILGSVPPAGRVKGLDEDSDDENEAHIGIHPIK